MKTFEFHHALVYGDEEAQGDKLVTVEEFIEYYNNVSCSIENDSYFDLMITNAWQLDGNGNPASMPYAGVSKKVAHVSSRDAYRQDHHRNLFDTDKNTVWKKAKKVGDSWQTTTGSTLEGVNHSIEPDNAAGSSSFYNQDGYKNQFASSRDTHGGYSGIKNTDDELIK
jgi:hypothetical protein